MPLSLEREPRSHARAGLPSGVPRLQLRFDNRRGPTGDLCCMSNGVALLRQVYGIPQAPAGLGVRHRADSHWTWWDADTRGMAEATTATRGHIYLWLLLLGRVNATSETTLANPNAVSSDMAQVRSNPPS
jgi:hypothetical protein